MKKVLELFEKNNVNYSLYNHEPVYTSDQASRVRGVELKTGVKALLVRKSKERQFILADIAADRKLDFKKLEMIAGTKKLQFATREEVIKVTNCEPGSVHPIGKLFGIDTYLDKSVLENEFVNFNIGMLTRSARISSKDLVKLLLPLKALEFSRL